MKKGLFGITVALLLCLVATSTGNISVAVSYAAGPGSVVTREAAPMYEAEVFTEANSQPYTGLYMRTFYNWWSERGPNAKGVSVTVSFAGTDQSKIQSDNWLSAGIAAQGPDSTHGGCNAIDWGYIFSLVLGSSGDPYIHGEVIEGHEWVNCFPGYAVTYYAWNSYVGGLTISSTVTLTMQWTEYPSFPGYYTLDYYAIVDGRTWLLLQFVPAESASPYFMTGTQDREWWIIPLGGVVKWLEFFGAWSSYNIGRTGWHSYVTNPRFLSGGTWNAVQYAYSVQGNSAFMDNTLVWGGDPYTNVYAAYHKNWVHFYPTTGSTLPDDTELWTPPPPREPSCPYVFTWDGQRYLMDNNLLPTSNKAYGSDVEDYYKLEQPLNPFPGSKSLSQYALKICEFENEHDYIDQVKLLAIAHDTDVKIAISPEHEILTYRDPKPPISCVDDKGKSRLSEVVLADGNVADKSTYFYGERGDYLVLDFGTIDAEYAKLILRDDMKCEDTSMYPPCCIEVQVFNNGEWQTVSVLAPRELWATEGVDLSQYIAPGQGLVRLFWTMPHRLDYVGLDTTPPDDFTVQEARLVSATYATGGSALTALAKNDNEYAELVPGQQILLTFSLKNDISEQRTLVLYSEGHYTKIP